MAPVAGEYKIPLDNGMRVVPALFETFGGFSPAFFDLLRDGELMRSAPLAVARSPVALALAAVTGVALAAVGWPDEATSAALAEDLPGTVAQALCVAFALALPLGRVALVGLIEERDAVLARSIRQACRGDVDGEVVAVLGAAHVNGVRRRLSDSG